MTFNQARNYIHTHKGYDIVRRVLGQPPHHTEMFGVVPKDKPLTDEFVIWKHETNTIIV
jgi:hypothetical protein